MIVKIRVNWEKERILSEKEAEEFFEKEYLSDYLGEDSENFGEWLYNNYTHLDVWHMTKEEREKAYRKFEKETKEERWEDFEYDFPLFELEV